ncbi:hypothetical protein LEN26_019968 [Aphanomyces euteiches]|nr:hypothetical protein LEN26_019968 [Aphanomyces euteiches]KAH9111819.1 hypothetical protein AeMF1_013746 [Aphanomyces euteiches]
MVATYEEIMEAIKRVECGESKAAVVRSSNETRTVLFHYIKMKKDKGKIIKKKTGPKQFIPSNIETDFVEWIAAMQRSGNPVRRSEIIEKAGIVLTEIYGVPRAVSRGWYEKFCLRNPILANRVAQTLSKCCNKVTKDGIISYFNMLVKSCLAFHCSADVYNVDETSFKTKTKGKRVVAVRGSKNVWDCEKETPYHLTIVLTAAADGTLAPPAFVLPGKSCGTVVLDDCCVENTLVTTSPKAFMNSVIFNTWLIQFGEWKLANRVPVQPFWFLTIALLTTLLTVS